MRRLLFPVLMWLASCMPAATPETASRAAASLGDLGPLPAMKSFVQPHPTPPTISNADLARDLRLLVRERLKEGDSNEQVLDYVVSRYGEFVLLKPRFSVRTVLLWGTPVAILMIGIVAIVLGARGRRGRRAPPVLSADEQAEIERLMKRGE